MSYDIFLYDREFFQTAFTEGLEDWTDAPPIPNEALTTLRDRLGVEGFVQNSVTYGEEWTLETDTVFAQVSVFDREVAFSIPYSDLVEASVELCEKVGRAVADQYGLAYYDPQTVSAEEADSILNSALADFAGADQDRRRLALEILASLEPSEEMTNAVVPRLVDDAEAVRRAAAKCLVEFFSANPDLATATAVVALGKALSDPAVPVRTFAANALAVVGSRAAPAKDALQAATADESYGPRGYARMALDAIARKEG